jgi:predicted TIM-barrel fold metal-dependent hydrolase
MRFFDANCRIGQGIRLAPGGIETAADLLKVTATFDIERALVHATESRTYDPLTGNEQLTRRLAGYENLEPCWVVLAPDPAGSHDQAAYVEKAVASGVRAMWAFNGPAMYHFPLTDWMCGDLLAALECHRMPLFIEALASPWSEVLELCLAHPALPVVCVRPKYREARWVYALLRETPNFHFTFDFFAVHRCIEDICKRFGPERLIFASDLPDHSPAVPIGMVTYAGVDDESKALIAAGNLERLLGGVQ